METAIKPPQGNKESFILKNAGKKIVLYFPRDVALSNSDVKEDLTARILFKANEMHQCQMIVHNYKDIMNFTPRSMWDNAVKTIKDALQMNKNQTPKIFRVFNCCEDARRECGCFDGK
eukprot:416879-Ditylum_brightwellii.AAC.1